MSEEVAQKNGQAKEFVKEKEEGTENPKLINHQKQQEDKIDYENELNDVEVFAHHNANLNQGTFHIIKDYLNLLVNKGVESNNFEISDLFSITNFKDLEDVDQIPDEFLYRGYLMVCKYRGELDFWMNLHRYINSEGYERIGLKLASKHKTYYNGEKMYKNLLYEAIEHSGLRGSCFAFRGKIGAGWYFPKISKRTLEDIYIPGDLMDEVKLYEEHFDTEGELMRYLLSGPPGTGKTEANKALSNILNQKGVTVIMTGITEDLKTKVEIAELLSPSVLVIDDIDMYLGNRKKGMFTELLHTFLNVLDGFEAMSEKVGLIATTNSIDLLDIAAQRPGRFDNTLMMDRINKDNIKGIILKSLSYERGIEDDSEEAEVLTDPEILKKLEDYKFTGSRIYSSIKHYMRKVNARKKDKKVDKNEFLRSIEDQRTKMNKMYGKNGLGGQETLKEEMENQKEESSMGFTQPSEEEVEEDDGDEQGGA